MIAAYLFLNYNCILLCETSLYYPWGHSNLPFSECYLKILLCVIFDLFSEKDQGLNAVKSF